VAPEDGESAAGGGSELLPLFPLGTVLVPGMPLSLHVFEQRYRTLVVDLLNGAARETDMPSGQFGVVALRHGWEVGELGDVHGVGTVARITKLLPLPDGRYELAAVGTRRFRIFELKPEARPYLMARVEYLPEPDGDGLALRLAVARQAWRRHLTALGAIDPAVTDMSPIDTLELSAPELGYTIAQLPSLTVSDRQLLLASPDTADRLALASRILRRETRLLQHTRTVPTGAASFRLSRGAN
jgi:Lon protease-like protein